MPVYTGENPYYYCISEEYIKSMLSKVSGGNALMSSLSFEDKENCVHSKQQIETLLSANDLLCCSWWGAIESFICNKPYEFISAKLSDVEYHFDRFTGWPAVFASKYKYCFKKIDIVFYYLLLINDAKRKAELKRAEREPGYESRYRGTAIENAGATEFELLAKMMWDGENDRIILTPIIISDVRGTR